MIKHIKETLEEKIGHKLKVTEEELKEMLDEIGKDIVYNYLVFKKDATYDIFCDNLKIYLSMKVEDEKGLFSSE